LEDKPLSLQRSEIFFSIIIPANNEEDSIQRTCAAIVQEFSDHGIGDYEILVINDHSTDGTEKQLKALVQQASHLRYLQNTHPEGFGYAVRKGLENFSGQVACLVMADLSDSPQDIFEYYERMKKGAECVFGSRFVKGSEVINYPWLKLLINRLANWFIRALFGIHHNDITNAFKAYRREVIEGISPIISPHFNLTVELPLKAIVRGYSYETVPVSWTNRMTGVSKLKLKEMGSRYLFIVLYVLLEKLLSKGDYRRQEP
jgi:dolichol-phosphate mannosyltransferase